MLQKSRALALRIWPNSNTSLIVAWLTPEHGKVVTLMKGALRPKSVFLGQCDLFYSCELIFYTRSRSDLFIAKEVTPLQDRRFLRTDWRSNCAASYWSQLIFQTSVDQAPHEAAFRLSNTILNQLEHTLKPALVLLWGELKLLQTLGVAPELNNCCLCHKSFSDGAPTVFAIDQGGAVCAACQTRVRSNSIRVSPDIVAILRLLQKANEPDVTRTLVASSKQFLELRHTLGLFLQFHLGTERESRDIALNLLQRTSLEDKH